MFFLTSGLTLVGSQCLLQDRLQLQLHTGRQLDCLSWLEVNNIFLINIFSSLSRSKGSSTSRVSALAGHLHTRAARLLSAICSLLSPESCLPGDWVRDDFLQTTGGLLRTSAHHRGQGQPSADQQDRRGLQLLQNPPAGPQGLSLRAGMA